MISGITGIRIGQPPQSGTASIGIRLWVVMGILVCLWGGLLAVSLMSGPRGRPIVYLNGGDSWLSIRVALGHVTVSYSSDIAPSPDCLPRRASATVKLYVRSLKHHATLVKEQDGNALPASYSHDGEHLRTGAYALQRRLGGSHGIKPLSYIESRDGLRILIDSALYGRGWHWGAANYPGFSLVTRFPLLLTCAVLLVPTLLVGRRLWRCLSMSFRQCRVCDYDLRGNAAGLCPECGTVIPEEQRARLGLATARDAATPTDTAGESPSPAGRG